jgi:hypothetical protein
MEGERVRFVDQTKFGVREGNCFAACVASLLDLTIVDVPHLMAEERWFEASLDWLEPRGFWAICLRTQERDQRETIRGLYVLSGRSPRGDFLHSVVARGDTIEHDPHPSRAGLLTRDDAILIVPFAVQAAA